MSIISKEWAAHREVRVFKAMQAIGTIHYWAIKDGVLYFQNWDSTFSRARLRKAQEITGNPSRYRELSALEKALTFEGIKYE